MDNMYKPQNLLAVGIDPSKDTLGISLIRYPEEELFNESIPNLPEAFADLDAMVCAAAGKLGLTPAYGLEDTGRYGKALCDFLCARGRVVKEVNPILTHHQRAFYGQDKSDGIDAKCVGVILMRRFDRLPGRDASAGVSTALKQLSSFRHAQVKLRGQLLNQLHHALEQTYLNVYQPFFSDLKHKAALAFFQSYPMPQSLKGSTEASLDLLLRRESRNRIKDRAAGILAAAATVWGRPLSPSIQAASLAAALLCGQIARLNQDIAAVEKNIAALVKETGIPLTSVNGIDIVRAGVILGQTGDPRRFTSKHAYAKYNGTAPCVYGTGRFQRHVSNHFCNRTLRHEFHQLALHMADHDPLSMAYVQRHMSDGLKSKGQAINRLARRISDVLYAMMLSKENYDPQIAANNMERKRPKSERRRAAVK
jgi:transposase